MITIFKKSVSLKLNSNRGFSLIEILASVAILSVVSLAFATVITTQMREYRSLTEKLGTTDLQRVLSSALADNNVCDFVLNTQNEFRFDTTAAFPQEKEITGPLYFGVKPAAGGNPAVPGAVVAQVGSTASVNSNSLVVSKLKVKIVSGNASSYLGSWVVEFDPHKTVREVKPLEIPATFGVDIADPSAAKVTSCSVTSGGGGGAPPPGNTGSCPTVITTENVATATAGCFSGREGKIQYPALLDPNMREIEGNSTADIQVKLESANDGNVNLKMTVNGGPEETLCPIDKTTWKCTFVRTKTTPAWTEVIPAYVKKECQGYYGSSCVGWNYIPIPEKKINHPAESATYTYSANLSRDGVSISTCTGGNGISPGSPPPCAGWHGSNEVKTTTGSYWLK